MSDIFDKLATQPPQSKRGDIFDKLHQQGGVLRHTTDTNEKPLEDPPFYDPYELAVMAVTGGTMALPQLFKLGLKQGGKAVLQQAADWGTLGIPRFAKELPQFGRNLLKGMSAKAIEERILSKKFGDKTIKNIKEVILPPTKGPFTQSPIPAPQRNIATHIDVTPIKFDPNLSVEDMRAGYSGSKHTQWVKGNFLAEDLKAAVPDLLDRQALTIFRDAHGDIGKMKGWRTDPRLKEYYPILDRALSLSDSAKMDNTSILDPYYKATGKVGMDFGFLDNVRDDYINRVFPAPEKGSLPKKFFEGKKVKGTRIVDTQLLPELSQSTYHAKPRHFDHLLDRVATTGEKPTTLDSADLLRLYNREFGQTLSNVKMINALTDIGVAHTILPGKPLPSGWVRVGNSNTIIPEELHLGLRAILEPDFTHKIDAFRKLNKYQGLVKTVDLSMSLFHHFTMVMQGLYQTKFGLELLLPSTQRFMQTSSFREILTDGAEHGLMTSNIDANKDVLYKLAKGNDGLSKVINAPVIKQGFNILRKNNEFLFDKLQKWLKVMDYGKQVAKWGTQHPQATESAVVAAKRSIAQEVNSAYGGLNWEILGHTPSFQGLSRVFMLAPDWTYSNYYLAKQALTMGGPGGTKARSHYLSALIGAGVITEGLNKLTTGHYTNENSPGHEFEVEMPSSDPSKAVHISFFRGGIGDALKYAAQTYQYGPLGGALQFASGKASPFVKTGIGLGANYNYGEKLFSRERSWLENSGRISAFLGETAGPIPFGVGGVTSAAWKGVPFKEDWSDPLIYLMLASGVGRVSNLPIRPPKNY